MASNQVKAQKLANEANIRNVDATNENQIELMREQNEWNLEQWDRENQYNSPAAQRARLEAAGLNPLLLDGWSSGNASSPAQGVNPPQLTAPQVQPEFGDPQITANAFQQIAGAFKNFGEYSKSMSESGINMQQFGFVREMSLKGMNPELIKARSSLELYNQLITQGHYQVPQIEAIIRDYNQRANFHAWSAEERRSMCDNLRAQYEGIKFTNQFNKDKAPLELAKLYAEVRDIYLGTNIKANVAESQINLADKQGQEALAKAGLASAQTDLAEEQTETQKRLTQAARYENAVKKFRAGLANIGINPDDKNLPFFFGLGQKLYEQKVNPYQVSDLFDAIGNAEKIGWRHLYRSGADLTRFQIQGSPQGPLGAFGTLKSLFEDINAFKDEKFGPIMP